MNGTERAAPDELSSRVDAHRASLLELDVEGGPFAKDGPNATFHHSGWFDPATGLPGAARRELHTAVLARVAASHPDVGSNRRAVLVAGPPGAGKSSIAAGLLSGFGAPGKTLTGWLPLNNDLFKDELLLQALADGSYETVLKPKELLDREATGEVFFPRELASLVHEESSQLFSRALSEAVERGQDLLIDDVLGEEEDADGIMRQLDAAGYQVILADVETSRGIAWQRIEQRWREGYLAALEGTATGTELLLGGRWVPPSIPAALYPDGGSGDSVCAAVGAAVAGRYACVRQRLLYRVEAAQAQPVPVDPGAPAR